MSTSRLTLAEVYEFLKSRSFVDLTHAFAPGILDWPGSPTSSVRRCTGTTKESAPAAAASTCIAIRTWDSGGRTRIRRRDFIRGLRTLDQIDCKEMILPLVVIDIHSRAAANPDTQSRWKT